MTSPPIPSAEEDRELWKLVDAVPMALWEAGFSGEQSAEYGLIMKAAQECVIDALQKGRLLERQSLLDSGWTATVLEEMRGENVCDSCAGEGKPISGLPCMCRGTGKMSEAARYLRERMVVIEAERDKYKEAVNSADALLCDALIDTDWDKVGEACSLLCVALAPRAGGTG